MLCVVAGSMKAALNQPAAKFTKRSDATEIDGATYLIYQISNEVGVL